MSARASALLQAALRRPVEDVLSRCKLSSKSPSVTTLTSMMSEAAAPLILAKWPACRHQHVDEASPSDTQCFDLVLTGTPGPAHLATILERVSPGGALAMAVSDPPLPQLALLRAAAATLREPKATQEARVAAVAASPPETELYYDALLGPLCTSLDVWRTTYTHRLPDADTAWRCYAQAEPALGGVELEAVDAETRRRFESAFPARADGTILVPSTHLCLLAKRPSLVGIYAEYVDYHNNQLDKGWKS
jgi:trans-aconitate methyltransferase